MINLNIFCNYVWMQSRIFDCVLLAFWYGWHLRTSVKWFLYLIVAESNSTRQLVSVLNEIKPISKKIFIFNATRVWTNC